MGIHKYGLDTSSSQLGSRLRYVSYLELSVRYKNHSLVQLGVRA